MSVVGLEILEPKDGANFVGTRSVRLRGRVLTSGHGKLYFKWYSNLVTEPPTKKNTDTSLNRDDPAALDFTPTLHVGSQVITFTARDVAEEEPEKLKAVKHAGMAGGPPVTPPPPGAPPPCVIHVLHAEVTEPAENATLSQAKAALGAKAPPLWADEEYRSKVNKIQFRWSFEPTGAPPDRTSVDFVPGPKSEPPPAFDDEKFILRYEGKLPAELVPGAYLLRLRVERLDQTSVGHDSDPRKVFIVR